MISNLLTNAAKYTDPQGEIRLTASVTEEHLVFSVADNGIGLSPESIPDLFTMFSQVDSKIDRREGGLGIGLSLVKGLVELYGGTVEAHSKGLRQGSEFTVRLPASLITSRTTALGHASSAPQHTLTTRPAKVLVVDDNRDAAETLATALKLAGYEVRTAFSGPHALEMAIRDPPQAVVLDVGMPGMDGYETTRRMRREAWGREVVIVALTGWGEEQDKADAKAAGFDDHLTKPIDLASLEAILTRLLEQQTCCSALNAQSGP